MKFAYLRCIVMQLFIIHMAHIQVYRYRVCVIIYCILELRRVFFIIMLCQFVFFTKVIAQFFRYPYI